MSDRPGLVDATRTGLRRAGFHMLKAGYEVLTGVSALLEEIGRTRRDDLRDQGPTRIPVEPDEGPTRIPLDDDGD